MSTVFPTDESNQDLPGAEVNSAAPPTDPPAEPPADPSVNSSVDLPVVPDVLDDGKAKEKEGDNVVLAEAAPEQQDQQQEHQEQPKGEKESEKVSFVQGLKDKVENKFPKDRALRMLFYTNFIFILAGIALLIFAIVWIAITRGTTFGAYSLLLFIAAVLMSGISVINILVLCCNPTRVFIHAVMAIVTFFVFIALLILAIILGGFHILTINFEYAVFKMDFEYFQDKLNLDTEEKVKAVDGSYFYLALILGIVTALIIIAMFILSTIVCCQYVQCNYFMPFFCGLMPYMVGIFGIVFAISLGSVGAMTRTRYSFIYNPQGWIIFLMGLVDLFVSFVLLGCFFGCTCKSSRNQVMKDATYPEEGYFGDNNRSDVLGFDYWNCKHEFCILLWINAVVCSPVFVVILVMVVINGAANHDVPLPCYVPNQLIHCEEVPDTSLLLASSSFASLSSFSDPQLPRNYTIPNQSSDEMCAMIPTTCIDYTPKTNPNPEWSDFAGQCEEFKMSAAKYSLMMGITSLDQYTSSTGSFSTHTFKTLGARRTLLSRTRRWAADRLHLDTKASSEETASASEGSSESAASPSASLSAFASLSSSSFDTPSMKMVDTVLAMSPEQQQELEREGDEENVFEYEGEEYGYRQSNGATTVVRHSHSDLFDNNNTLKAAKIASNRMVCHDYRDVVMGWQEDIETFGADMCRITGFAMLVPAAPILVVDGIVFVVAMVVATAIFAWIWILCAYYVCYCITACCSQEHVTDSVEIHGNTITEYYHIEDHSPDFNCCICCGIVGCCQFICLFSACVLNFCLKDDWCGISCNKADRRRPKEEPAQAQAEDLQQQQQQMDPAQLAYMQTQQQQPTPYSPEQIANMQTQGQQMPAPASAPAQAPAPGQYSYGQLPPMQAAGQQYGQGPAPGQYPYTAPAPGQYPYGQAPPGQAQGQYPYGQPAPPYPYGQAPQYSYPPPAQGYPQGGFQPQPGQQVAYPDYTNTAGMAPK